MSGAISLLGTTALLFEAPGACELASQQRIWALARAVEAWPEVREAVPGMNNLMLAFDTPPRDLAQFEQRLRAAWDEAAPLPLQGRVVELPVTYGGEAGPHLQDVLVHTGLGVDELVERHSAPLYPVFALGSHPGYCYLGGMDSRIATPRRTVPVLRIPAAPCRSAGRKPASPPPTDPVAGTRSAAPKSASSTRRAHPGAARARRLDPLPRPGCGPMIDVLTTPGLATVQDLGRFGSLRYGVGTAGAMDLVALRCANLLLGNDEGAAAIEVPLFPFSVRFRSTTNFALTGGGGGARLGGRALLPWSVHSAEADEELVLSPGGVPGSRLYLALPGGIDVPDVLGSRSTQLRGGFGGRCGRALQPGDSLCARSTLTGLAGYGLQPPGDAPAIRVLPAAEYARFTAASQEAFWAGAWQITAQSDRYGYRLAGTPLAFQSPVEMLSHGIVPGVIQVPPSGQPIIQMRDAQPSGGYPKIGTVIEADLWRLGQAPAGSRIRFIETDWAGALAAADELRAWLDEAARLAELVRGQKR